MKAELKKRLQCNNCDMPYCNIRCNDLSDKDIDWIMKLANQRVIEELERLINPVEDGFGKAVIIRRIKELKARGVSY